MLWIRRGTLCSWALLEGYETFKSDSKRDPVDIRVRNAKRLSCGPQVFPLEHVGFVRFVPHMNVTLTTLSLQPRLFAHTTPESHPFRRKHCAFPLENPEETFVDTNVSARRIDGFLDEADADALINDALAISDDEHKLSSKKKNKQRPILARAVLWERETRRDFSRARASPLRRTRLWRRMPSSTGPSGYHTSSIRTSENAWVKDTATPRRSSSKSSCSSLSSEDKRLTCLSPGGKRASR